MFKKIILLSTSFILLSNITPIYAEEFEPIHNHCESTFKGKPQGFEKTINLMAVSDLKNAKDAELVRVKGKVTKFLGDEQYELTDENNDKILIELKNGRDWSFIHKDDPIELIAKYDKNFFSADLLEVQCALPPEPPMARIGERIPPRIKRSALN